MAFDNFNTGNFGSGLVSGLTQGLGYGQQQRAHQLARDKLDEQVRQYDQNYSLQQDNYNLNKTQTDLNVEANKRAVALQPGALKAQELANVGIGLDNQKKQIDFTRESNDTWIGNAVAGDEQTAWITPDDPTRLNRENSLRNVIAGGRENDFLILDTFNRDPHLPEGFKYDRIVRKDGSLAISGTYTSGPKKGQKGVLTEDGGIGDDSQIAALPPEMVVGLIDGEYTTNIRGASEGGKSSWVVQYKVANYVAQGVSQEEAEIRAVEEVNTDTATATLQTQVQGEVDRASVDPETGEKDARMSRSFRSILASAETDTEKLGMLIDQAETMGIEVPDILQAALQRGSVDASQPQTGATPEATGQAPSGTPLWKRNEKAPDPEAEVAALDADIEKAEASISISASKTGGRQNRIRDQKLKRVEELKAQRAALLGTEAGGLSDIQNQSAEVKKAAQALETGIFAGIDELSPEEIEQKATSGELQATPQDEANLAAVLKEAGIESPADIPVKLPPKAQIAAYTWLMTIAPDNTARESIRKELHNLRTSGRIDASRLDLQTLEVNRQNALTSWMRLGLDKERFEQAVRLYEEVTRPKAALELEQHFLAVEKHDWGVGEVYGKRLAESFQQAKFAVYGSDDGTPKGNINDTIKFDKARFYKEYAGAHGAFTRTYQDYRKSIGTAAEPQMQQALNSMVSLGFQALAESEEFGPLFANLMPDGEIDHIGSSDIFLNRLAVDKVDGSGKPKTFKVINPASQLQVEETIPASVIKNLFGASGYTYVVNEIKEGPGSLADKNRNLASATSRD
jgi:hypothetical protein